MPSANACSAQDFVNMLLVQKREQPANRYCADEPAFVISYRHISVMALDSQQRDRFGIVVRPDFDRRIAAQIAEQRLRRGRDKPFYRNLAGQNRGFVNQVKMTRFLRLLFAQSFERNAGGFARLRLRDRCCHQFFRSAYILRRF
jgi:hypothetical protein